MFSLSHEHFETKIQVIIFSDSLKNQRCTEDIGLSILNFVLKIVYIFIFSEDLYLVLIFNFYDASQELLYT